MSLLNGTMTPIQTVTVGAGGAAQIEFTSIPQTYTDLVIKVSARSTVSQANNGFLFDIRPNGSSANMTRRSVYGNGSGTASSSGTDGYNMVLNPSDYTANTFSNTDIYIPNYTSSNNKSISTDTVSENNGTTVLTLLGALLWSNTAAITSVTLNPFGGNFAQHSTATLYGVTSAGYGAKATGGVITQDENYYYHNFYASGDFIPSTNLSCDYLVVGGGGPGGAAYLAGGGGAGGYRTATGTSFSNGTTYTITVGAGGAGKDAQGAFNGRNNGSPSSISGSGFNTFTSSGGGCGGHNQANVTAGVAGGSGGGAANPPAAAGSGNVGGYSPSEGNAGGLGGVNGNGSQVAGGGGGGAGAVGGNGAHTPEVGGAGGAGLQWLNGSYYAGGGGGAVGNSATGGVGGIGGGATGGGTSAAPAGSANTGGGGGAAGSFNGGAGIGGNGGSGIVIIRYPK